MENSTSTNSAILDEDFNRSFPPPGWTTFIGKNGIGDEDNWGLRFPSTAAVESEDVNGGLAEDWLVTPSLRPSAENSTFTFDAEQDAEGDQGSIYTVRVSTKSQNNPDDFEVVQTYTEADLGTEDNTATLTADLSAYQGQDIYVALVMENDNGDEFILEKAGGIPLTPNQILVSQYGNEAVLSRGGANEVVQVELTSKPKSPVTLNFSTGTAEILPVESITFTPDNWQETQNVNLELAQFGSTGEPETNFDLNIAVETTDPAYSQVNPPPIAGTIVDSGIPEFPSYRTVEETYADLANLAEDNPEIAEWVDIGDSYDKVTPGGPEGNDIYAIELTNENSDLADEDKPTLYVEGAIHAREYTPGELVTRFAEELVAGYGENADTTWILDNFKVAVVPIVNPDGRNFAEEGFLWRKNTNPNPPPGEEAAPFPDYGVDLNRNFDVKWGEIEGGSSNDPSRFDYRGTEAFSEPETQAVRDYVTSLFPDQKAPGFEAAPNDATGVFIDVHSFFDLVLYPFSWTDLPAGNKKELETLGRKFGYFTGVDGEAYDVAPWNEGIGATDGDAMGWAYNEFGVASYTLELGTEFFQDTEDFESTIAPEVMPALMYAAKTAYRPYQQPAGPETLEVSTDLTQVVAGTEVTLSATADDTRYDDGESGELDSESEPVQNIAQARYTVDTPPWQEGAEFFNLEPADGELDSSVEELTAKIDTSNLSPGRHTIFVESQDADGNFGVPSAVFIDVLDTPEDTDLQVPYSNLVVFGDSLSDVGNVLNATEGLIPPSPPYGSGRFSNGDLVVDAIAEELELPENESFFTGGNNYAFGAAETGEGTSEYDLLLPEPINVPNIGQQIDLYLADRTPTETDLFYVYGGANDFISPVLLGEDLPTAETIVGNITNHITELAEAGAQNFVVPNLPSLGDIPLFNGQPEATTILNDATKEFNRLLDTELDAIASELEVEIIEPDIYSIVTEIQNNPTDFGLSNTTDAFFDRTDPIADPTDLSLTGNPEEFFFWDIIHPTATATEIIAEEAVVREIVDDPRNPEARTLINGVASGDTTQNATVLWTRSLVEGNVTFEYATDPEFENISGTVEAEVTDTDVPVKVDLTDLEPGTDYYYRVSDAAGDTEIGEFTTSAELGTYNGFRFGATGDWQQAPPYPSLSNADDRDLELFVKLGDTIYADLETPALPGVSQARELSDFRTKQAEVLTSRVGLNTVPELYADTSILATIDDHEIVDNFAGGAAPGESPDAPDIGSSDEPLFTDDVEFVNDTEVYESALQAYQEYHPLQDRFYGETGEARTANERQLYRFNTYGSDAAVIMLDSRSFRDDQIEPVDLTDPDDTKRFFGEAFDPDRTLLGREQVEDLKTDLLAADAAGITWKFVTIPEPIQNFGTANAEDRFEGYAAERNEILQFIDENQIDNVVFMAGDFHGTIVNNLTYQTAPGSEQIATNAFEIVTGPAAFNNGLFGPTVVELSAAIGAVTPEEEALFNSLPVANDADSEIDDRDDFAKNLLEVQTDLFNYDPVGLNNNLPVAEGAIDAELIQGDYVAVNTFGWTEFDIDAETQQLKVTTYGIDPYSEAELLAHPNDIINRTPRIVSEFVVDPQGEVAANSEFTPVFGTTEDDTLDAAGTNNLVFAGEGDDTVNIAEGNNRIYGDGGDDALFLGTGDYVVGGEGSDQFWVADTELPDTPNRIADFEIGSDVIGLSNLGISFEDLTLTQDGDNTLIAVEEQTAAILTSVDANSLSADNFAFN